MTVQFKVEWNGYDAGGVYTLSAPEEARLIAAGIAFNYVPVPQVQGGLTSAQLAAGAVAPAAVSSTGSILGADGSPVSGGAVAVQDEGAQVAASATSLNFTGAGVTASASGGAATINIPGGGGTTQNPFLKFEADVRRIYDGNSAVASVMVIGDSVSGDVIIPLMFPMWNACGNAGAMNSGAQLGTVETLAGGAAMTTVDDFTTWMGGKWLNMPASSSAALRFDSAYLSKTVAPVMSGLRVGWLNNSVGSFKVQTSPDGTTWTDIAGSTTNVTASGGVSFATFAAAVPGNQQFRILNISGTVNIVSRGWTAASGVRFSNQLSIGGSQLKDYMTAPQAVWDAFLTNEAPDLIFVYFKDDVDSAYTAGLASLQARLTANCPLADVVYIGPTNSQIDDPGYTPAPTTAQTSAANRAALQAHVATITGMRAWYWDASKVWGTWAAGNALGLFQDATHPNDTGRHVLAAAFMRDTCLMQGLGTNVPWNIGSTQIDRAGGFLKTGGTISGATRITDTSDVPSSVLEAASSAAARIAGGLHVSKVIKTDTGFAIGTDLGTSTSFNISRNMAGSGVSGSCIEAYLYSTNHATSGNWNWRGSQSFLTVNHGGTATNTGAARGAVNYLKEAGSGTGAISTMDATYSYLEIQGSHPLTDASGSCADLSLSGTGAITNLYGFRLRAAKYSGATPSNFYGVYLPSTVVAGLATSTWGFYNAGNAPSYSAGPWTWKPLASATPANNGDLTFEATSNTSVTVKLKGSDGVVRSAVLTLA